MTEKEIINNLKELKGEVQPDKEWVNVTKTQIFNESEVFSGEENNKIRFTSIFNLGSFQKRAVATALASIIIVIGLFGFAERSVPGDSFYALKKLKEEGAAMLVSSVDRPLYELERANRRLEEMEKIVHNNQTENLAPAINEYKESVHSASEEIKNADPDKETTDKIVMQSQKLKEIEREIENQIQASIGGQELDKSLIVYYKKSLKELINDLKDRSLTKDKRKNLEEAEEILNQEDLEIGDIQEAKIKLNQVFQD